MRESFKEQLKQIIETAHSADKNPAWITYEEDMKRYYNLSNDDMCNIIKSGIDSEFWKLLRSKIAMSLYITDQSLKRLSIDSLDACISLAKFNATYKALEELLQFPSNYLKSIEMMKQMETKKQTNTIR
jgi:DNA-directed RNA polymerase alpha subunit